MPGEDRIAVEGLVVEVLGHGLFRVELANGHRVLAHPTRQTRPRLAGLAPGGRVRLEMSPYDMSTGRIVDWPANGGTRAEADADTDADAGSKPT